MPTHQIRLTERDYTLLDALADYRFLSIAQATALFFPSTQAASRRLHELVKAKLAVTVFMPVRPYSRKTETVFGLSARGATALTPRRNGLRPRHLTEREVRSGLHLDHTLRRNDVRACLERLPDRMPRFALLSWQQHPDQVRAAARVRLGRRIETHVKIIPDGVAVVKVGSRCEVLAIEIDRGTVPVRSMWRRFRAYWAWWRAHGARARHGPVPYRVLTLVPDEKRLLALAKAAADAPETGATGSKLFWFATQDQADLGNPERLVGPTWRMATVPTSRPCPLFPETASQS